MNDRRRDPILFVVGLALFTAQIVGHQFLGGPEPTFWGLGFSVLIALGLPTVRAVVRSALQAAADAKDEGDDRG